jgi:Na+/melibiose symporter-like transporter
MNVVISILLVFIAVAFAGYFISLVAKGPLFFSYFFLGMTVFLELMAVKLWRDMGQPVDRWLVYLVGVALVMTAICGAFHLPRGWFVKRRS